MRADTTVLMRMMLAIVGHAVRGKLLLMRVMLSVQRSCGQEAAADVDDGHHDGQCRECFGKASPDGHEYITGGAVQCMLLLMLAVGRV